MPYFSTYAATKAFNLALAEGIAEELVNEPVNVLALCPGATATNFHARAGSPIKFLNNAESPRDVARKALQSLGKRRVLISQFPMRLALAYNTIIHRVATAGIHAYLKRLKIGDRVK